MSERPERAPDEHVARWCEIAAAAYARRRLASRLADARRLVPIDLRAARGARQPRSVPTTTTTRPPDAKLAQRAPDRWFHADGVPELAPWETWLRDVFREAPRLATLRVRRATIASSRGADCTLRADDDGLHAVITINDDVPARSHEAERLLRHELAHLVHALALGDDWHKLDDDRDAAEEWARRMERELQPGFAGWCLAFAREVHDA